MKKLKKMGIILIATLMMTMPVSAKTPITTSKIMYRGDLIEVPTIVKDNTTYVGARALGNAINLPVAYDPGTNAAFFTTYSCRLTINLTTGAADINQYELGIAPLIVEDGSTYLPLRYICEKLAFIVGYENGIITIDTNGQTDYDIQNPFLSTLDQFETKDHYIDYLKKFDLLRELLCDAEESNQPIDMVRIHKVVAYMSTLEDKLKGSEFEETMDKYKALAEKIVVDFEDDGKLKDSLRTLLIDTSGFIYDEEIRIDTKNSVYNSINASSAKIMGWDI